MKIEAMSAIQNSIVRERRSSSGSRLSSNGLRNAADAAVIAIDNQQKLQSYDLNTVNIADDLLTAVSNIQTLAQSEQNLDGIHDLDLERVLRLIG
jgi:hypothetical protein